jgi:hypothetical protein
LIQFSLLLAFRDFSSLSSHFGPFSGVLRKVFGFLTPEVWEFSDATDHVDVTDYGCSGSRVGYFVIDAGGTAATTELLRREGGDDFFEARIAAERVPERIQF